MNEITQTDLVPLLKSLQDQLVQCMNNLDEARAHLVEWGDHGVARPVNQVRRARFEIVNVINGLALALEKVDR